MNILIISENFTRGGLETHLYTYYKELRKNNNVFFAFENYQDFGLLPDAKIETGFHFNSDVTIGDFVDDVNRLVKIVKENKIDFIHVHPFYSIYQASFVAQLTKTKLVYTYHGPASLTFTQSMFDEIMLEYALETTVSGIFSVSQRGVDGFSKMFSKDIFYLPNPIDTEAYAKTEIIPNKKWALVSRLDIDKTPAIIKFFEQLDKLEIDEIDVWGDGSEKSNLENIASRVNKKINFKGYSTNLNKELLNNYNGIIGIGRVAIEGLIMGYPVMLVGNDKVCGIIDSNSYEEIKEQNFVARVLNEKSVEEINNQLIELYSDSSKYYFREDIIENMGITKIASKYIEHINNLQQQTEIAEMIYIFNELWKCDKNARFHDDYNLLDILNKYVYLNTNDIFIKNKIMVLNKIKSEQNELNAKIYSLNTKIDILEQKIDDLNAKYNELQQSEEKYSLLVNENKSKINELMQLDNNLEYRINYLSKNINTGTILKNNIRRFLNIFKRKK